LTAVGRIVVGVDGSESGARALRWAVAEAARRGWSLDAVHAWREPFLTASPFVVADAEADALVEAARMALDDAIAAANIDEGATGVDVGRVLARGGAAAALLDASEGADLLVVGSRGRGGFARVLLGSVSHQVVHHAACAVVVVPAPRDGEDRGGGPAGPPAGPVVVGIDGSAASAAALRWALARPAAPGGPAEPVRAVLAWSYLDQHDHGFDPSYGEADALLVLERVVGEARAAVAPPPGGVERPVQTEVVNGLPAEVLLDASDGASLIVVGARGTGGFEDLLLGSVGTHLVHHAAVPVVVVRGGAAAG
jgi:nucleotide-binding universal stress UspA family protein